MRDHSYAWVLGAGASRSSGIPLAGDLVHRWLGELHRRHDGTGKPLSEWATAESLGIPEFKYESATTFYSRVYERRFRDNPDEGFACLEALMSGKDPSPGYSILAQVLEKTSHKIIISTNFDNLVADALSIYTETFPLVIGHESLANFVRVVSRRPVICKIHRDLLLGPKNDHRSLRRLHESWAAALRALFSQYTPLFIGYGGNDDSLMDLLESLDPEDIKGQLIWCYHESSEPSARIVTLVRQHAGALVAVPDFDLLMVLIGDQMGIEPIDDTIEKRADKRARQYREQLIKLDTTKYPEARRILRGAFERAGGTLVWLEKARSEVSTDQREEIYKQALEQYPDDLSLQSAYASFLYNHYRDDTRCRDLLLMLQANDSELLYQPSFYLSGIAIINNNQLEEGKKLLARTPDSTTKDTGLGLIAELEGDIGMAEVLLRRAAISAQDDTVLIHFLMRQNRVYECEAYWDQANVEGRSATSAHHRALYQWIARGDIGAGSGLVADESATNDDLSVMACFALANAEYGSCSTIMAALRSRPKLDWHEETDVAFLTLVHHLLVDGEAIPDLTELRTLLGRRYPKSLDGFRMLGKLADAVNQNLPKPYRKFVIALADACYDPACRNALSNFPQWRTPGAS